MARPKQSAQISGASHASPGRSAFQAPAFWSSFLPAALVSGALLWSRIGPVRPGTALGGCILACTLLLLRADQSSAREKTVWSVVALALLAAELRIAVKAHILAGSLLVGRLVNEHTLQIEARGGPAIPSSSLLLIDLDSMYRLEDARVSDDAQYAKTMQALSLDTIEPNR